MSRKRCYAKRPVLKLRRSEICVAHSVASKRQTVGNKAPKNASPEGATEVYTNFSISFIFCNTFVAPSGLTFLGALLTHSLPLRGYTMGYT